MEHVRDAILGPFSQVFAAPHVTKIMNGPGPKSLTKVASAYMYRTAAQVDEQVLVN